MRSVAGVKSSFWVNVAFQDGLALAFQFLLCARVWLAPDSRDAAISRVVTLAFFSCTALTLVLTRGESIRSPRVRAFVYRIGMFVPVVGSYFIMRHLLPALQTPHLDASLQAIDEAVLSVTPAVWMARYNTQAVVEWFAFFYFSYFYMLALFFLPALWVDRGRRAAEMLLGGFFVVAIGHLAYTLVPGLGPHATLRFDAPLQGGYWWGRVMALVNAAGAHLDIFPSLHTAFPTYIAIHAFAYRRTWPYRWLWPVLAFFALQIMTAALFLRWHWMVDIVAGLVLAGVSRRLAVILIRREENDPLRRSGRQPLWEPLFPWQRDP